MVVKKIGLSFSYVTDRAAWYLLEVPGVQANSAFLSIPFFASVRYSFSFYPYRAQRVNENLS